MSGLSVEKKFHLVDWALLCKSKDERGLGIRSLNQMNQALLGKWVFGGLERDQRACEGRCWWGNMACLEKDGMFRMPHVRHWPFGKDSFQLKMFLENLRYHIGSVERVFSFWRDRWVGERLLAIQFPNFF